jgi:hypothetical protein
MPNASTVFRETPALITGKFLVRGHRNIVGPTAVYLERWGSENSRANPITQSWKL